MYFATLNVDQRSTAVVRLAGMDWVPLNVVLPGADESLFDFIERQSTGDFDWEQFRHDVANSDKATHIALDVAQYGAPYTTPHKIWGIGLNFVEHAGDLSETSPAQPASFIKADHTIVGPGAPIRVPQGVGTVTSEAELGLVIGKTCVDVSREDALGYVFGVCPILDQTAEDILRQNPRYLTRAKNYPSFFAFGPEIESVAGGGLTWAGLDERTVATVKDGEVIRENKINRMMHGLAELVSFHSHVMPLFPGDIISTGTPGATPILPGDRVECRIDGLLSLFNPVE